ncbi:major facilitator superfamily domain-containing protein [Hyaloscypha finlandica]|nr:major facilitator superfamily domain-containing protein [Hyaloscypha finlandica]KAH8789090.1 major facilitator superfamily domain-containing protein [Hyaloscypha sp. PMI_1271]
MAPPPQKSGDAQATEKPQDIQLQDAPNNNKTEPLANEKTAPEPVPGGFSFLRTMKMRGLKGRGSGSASPAPSTDSNVGNGNGSGIDSKNNDELEVTQSNGSGDGPDRIGEVEALHEVRSDDELLGDDERGSTTLRGGAQEGGNNSTGAADAVGGRVYKVYKRRWFGLIQLVLLNIIVSWDWLSFSANSTTTSQYYNVTPSIINWLSTAFMFAFCVATPLVIYTLHHGGPKPSIITASVLILLGNWIRYGATKAGPHGNFGGVMFGQILTGLAQPFVLAAPTRYSDLWFTNSGRVAATAVMSLANPFGGALAQLIDPSWAGKPEDIPNMVLYIAIISSVASIPSFFIPAAPPTPCSPSGHEEKQALGPSLKFLFTCPEFYMIMVPFTVYVGLFNSISSLINQLLQPYSFTETEAGIAGALLIVVGLVTSAVTSPIIDKTKTFLFAIKLQVPIIAISYLAFTWAPQTRNIAAPYVILAVLGAASFSLVPVVLEYLIELTHPVSPEVTSTICWSGGQLLGGIFVLVSNALRDPGLNDGSLDDHTNRPPGNMWKALIFQTVIAMVVIPLPLALGCCGRDRKVRMRRVEADKEANDARDVERGVVVP